MGRTKLVCFFLEGVLASLPPRHVPALLFRQYRQELGPAAAAALIFGIRGRFFWSRQFEWMKKVFSPVLASETWSLVWVVHLIECGARGWIKKHGKSLYFQKPFLGSGNSNIFYLRGGDFQHELRFKSLRGSWKSPVFFGTSSCLTQEEGKVGAASCASLAGNLKGSRVGKSAYRVFVY